MAGPEAPAPGAERRPALDGVRAVAILAVIAYHFTTRLPGGFLGVDVFFLLSGYLITTLLLREREASGRIDLREFWARRARRLLPAVLIVVALCAIVTAAHESVLTFDARRGDMIATLLYYANWHFIAVGDSYFTLFTGQSPLEHMWSLAIEEQFYVAWPLTILLVGVLLRGHLLAVTMALAAGSALWMAVSYDEASPTATYIATHTRAATLLIGAALAILFVRHRHLVAHATVLRLTRRLWPFVAIVAAAAFFAMNDQGSFYYRGGAVLFALLVAAGIWIIEAEPRSLPARLMAVRPMAWIGTISYGLYLWHWPILQWVTSAEVANNQARQLVQVVLTFAAATASFYLVERPIRTGRLPWVGRSTTRLAIVAPIAIAAVALVAVQLTQVSKALKGQVDVQANLDAMTCPPGSPEPVPRYRWCVRAKGVKGGPVVATAGDSTAQALYPGVQAVARERGWRYVEAGRNRCSVLSLAFPNDPDSAPSLKDARTCITAVPRLLQDVEEKESPDVWIVSDRWQLLPLVTRGGTVVPPGTERHDRAVSRALVARFEQLTARGARVVLVTVPPPGPPVECVTDPGRADCRKAAFSIEEPRTVHARRLIERVVRRFRGAAVSVSVDDVVCPSGGRCPAAINGRLVRYDGLHYTKWFSRRVAEVIAARAEAAKVQFTPR